MEVGRWRNREAEATFTGRGRTLQRPVQRRMTIEEANPYQAKVSASAWRRRSAIRKSNWSAEVRHAVLVEWWLNREATTTSPREPANPEKTFSATSDDRRSKPISSKSSCFGREVAPSFSRNCLSRRSEAPREGRATAQSGSGSNLAANTYGLRKDLYADEWRSKKQTHFERRRSLPSRGAPGFTQTLIAPPKSGMPGRWVDSSIEK